jgi:hypothetical protein
MRCALRVTWQAVTSFPGDTRTAEPLEGLPFASIARTLKTVLARVAALGRRNSLAPAFKEISPNTKTLIQVTPAVVCSRMQNLNASSRNSQARGGINRE